VGLRPVTRGDIHLDAANLAGRTGELEWGETADGRAFDLFSLSERGVLYQVGVVAKTRDRALRDAATGGLRIATHVSAKEEPLAWLPPETTAVVGAPGADGPMVHLMAQYAGYAKRPIPCIAEVTSRLTASYQIWLGAGDRDAAGLGQGAIDRNALESCIEAALRALDASPRLTRHGAITEVDNKLGRVFVGWTSSWIVWHSERARVQQMLSSLRGRTLSPALAAALARVDRSTFWGASLQDIASPLFGVSSRSVKMELTSSAWRTGKSLDVTFDFGSRPQADQAAVGAKAALEGLPAELQPAARTVDVAVDGGLLRLILDSDVWMQPPTMATVQGLIDKKRAARGRTP
jgi:hypothetical protein